MSEHTVVVVGDFHPRGKPDHYAGNDFRESEIDQGVCDAVVGIPVLLDHDFDHAIGRVVDAYKTKDTGKLQAVIAVDTRTENGKLAERGLLDDQLKGLSLTLENVKYYPDPIRSPKYFEVRNLRPVELSICREGGRDGSFIHSFVGADGVLNVSKRAMERISKERFLTNTQKKQMTTASTTTTTTAPVAAPAAAAPSAPPAQETTPAPETDQQPVPAAPPLPPDTLNMIKEMSSFNQYLQSQGMTLQDHIEHMKKKEEEEKARQEKERLEMQDVVMGKENSLATIMGAAAGEDVDEKLIQQELAYAAEHAPRMKNILTTFRTIANKQGYVAEEEAYKKGVEQENARLKEELSRVGAERDGLQKAFGALSDTFNSQNALSTSNTTDRQMTIASAFQHGRKRRAEEMTTSTTTTTYQQQPAAASTVNYDALFSGLRGAFPRQ